jgi:N-acetylmuramoyl-L-alanine amidase
MKRLLVGLIPWMAGAAAGQAEPAVEAVFPGLQKSAQAWRIAGEPFVSLASFGSLGWEAKVQGTRVEADVEGRRLALEYRVQGTQTVVSLTKIGRALGGTVSPTSDGRIAFWGDLRRVKVSRESLIVDATMRLTPKVVLLEKPDRIVIDLVGTRITQGSTVECSADAKAGQFRPGTVRIVVQGKGAQKLGELELRPMRSFELRFDGSLIADEKQELRPPQRELSATSPSPRLADSETWQWTEDNPSSLPYDLEPPVWNGLPLVFAGPIKKLAENSQAALLAVGLSKPLSRAPTFSRPSPNVLEVVLPGARWPVDQELRVSCAAVKKLERIDLPGGVALRMELERPMGLQLTALPGEIHIHLIKPNVGDGRLAGKTVVVDAGHGGPDSGARSPDKGTSEKNLTLTIAKLVAQELSERGATVIMTRKTDVLIPLKERAEIANRNQADFFVSVHINSSERPNKSSGGITFYHASDPICWLLADCIQGEIAKVSGLPNLGTWSDTRIYDSGFAVLRYSKVPSVLLELGFINHAKDRKRMLESSFQRAVAEAVVKGIRAYLGDGKGQ